MNNFFYVYDGKSFATQDEVREYMQATITEQRATIAALRTASQGDDGLLPDSLMPVSKEWYALCERASCVDKIKISGELAEAIVNTVCQKPATPASQSDRIFDQMGRGAATPASASDAVYQIECDGYWYDTSAEYFHGHDGSEKRIIYTRPASAEPAYDRELDDWDRQRIERTLQQFRDKAAAHEAKRDASGEAQQGNMELRATLVQIERENREGWKQATHWRQLAEQQRAGVPAQVSMHDAPDACRDYVAWAQGWNDCRSSILAAAPKPQEGAGNG